MSTPGDANATAIFVPPQSLVEEENERDTSLQNAINTAIEETAAAVISSQPSMSQTDRRPSALNVESATSKVQTRQSAHQLANYQKEKNAFE